MTAPPRNRILDVYAAFVRSIGGWLAISDLIALLQPTGLDSQAVRSATSRMKRSGLLVPETVDGQAGYALSRSAMAILEDGDGRIFRPLDQESDTWVVALFSVPEAERSQRYQIRSRLERLGFGQGPAASWFAPSSVLDETIRMLQRSGLDGYVTLWEGAHAGFGDLEELVAQAWDTDEIIAAQEDYLEVADGIARRRAAGEDGDEAAWRQYLDNLAAWRPLPYLDPGLPPKVVPAGWRAAEARDRFTEMDATLKPAADRFFEATITTRRPPSRESAA